MKALINFLALVSVVFSSSVLAHGDEDKDKGKGLFKGLDTPAAKAVVTFIKALQTSDVKLARAQLADDMTIYEGGKVERSADEYAHHHMLSDMKFLSAIKSKTLEHQVTVYGNSAVSTSRSHMTGTYKDKELDFQSMATMVLEKKNNEWKIKHIHWSN